MHISWDLWGTLIESNPSYTPNRNALIRSIFKTNIPDELISQRKRLIDAVNEITYLHMPYNQMMAMIVGDSISGISKRFFSQALERFTAENDKLVKLYPPLFKHRVEDTLKRLTEAGITQSILSNTSFIQGRHLKELVNSIDVPFLFQLYSDEVGMSKPSTELFLEVNKRIPYKIIHVGDNAYADGGASNVGIEAYILSPTKTIYNLQDYLLCSHTPAIR